MPDATALRLGSSAPPTRALSTAFPAAGAPGRTHSAPPSGRREERRRPLPALTERAPGGGAPLDRLDLQVMIVTR